MSNMQQQMMYSQLGGGMGMGAAAAGAMGMLGSAMGGGEFAPPWDWNITVTVGPGDIDALIDYIRGLPVSLAVNVDGRVKVTG